jgi:predicted small integral membrane protein
MISIRDRNQNEERVKVFNINSTDLLILTILLIALKLDGYLDWSWLGVVAPISAWWLFGKLVVLVFGIFISKRER